MNETILLTGMICLTVIALALIGSKLPDDESEEEQSRKAGD